MYPTTRPLSAHCLTCSGGQEWDIALYSRQPNPNPILQEWDIARFSLPGRAGSGRYIIHMLWGGYRDALDVDLLPSPAVDVYGAASRDVQWERVDHAQFLDWASIPHQLLEPTGRGARRRFRPTCYPVVEGDNGEGVKQNRHCFF